MSFSFVKKGARSTEASSTISTTKSYTSLSQKAANKLGVGEGDYVNVGEDENGNIAITKTDSDSGFKLTKDLNVTSKSIREVLGGEGKLYKLGEEVEDEGVFLLVEQSTEEEPSEESEELKEVSPEKDTSMNVYSNVDSDPIS